MNKKHRPRRRSRSAWRKPSQAGGAGAVGAARSVKARHKATAKKKTQGNSTLDVHTRGRKGDMVENVFWSKPDTGKLRVLVKNYSQDFGMPFSEDLISERCITLMDPDHNITAPIFVWLQVLQRRV